MQDIAIAILAGGLSRRMGRDKAALPWDGASLLERIAGTAADTGLSVRIVGRPRPEGWPLPGVSFFADAEADAGPLGGLMAALDSGGEAVLALACDTPLLSAGALAWLIDAARRLPPGATGVVARNGERIEPLFAVYGPACREAAARRLAEGRLSLHGLIADAAFTILDAPAEVRAALVNVNTPDEWRNLEREATP